MDRVSAAEDGEQAATDLVRDVAMLDVAPDEFVEGALQRSLDSAHLAAIEAVRAAVARRLSLDLETVRGEPAAPDPSSSNGFQSAFLGEVATLEDVLSVVGEAAGRARRRVPAGGTAPLVFAAGEHARVATDDDHVPHRLLSTLDEGWMAIVSNPRGLSAALDRFVGDLAYAFAVSTVTLFVGMRSALGPPPSRRASSALVVQVLGSRSVLVQGVAHAAQQHQAPPGSVFLLPADRHAGHLPLDADTAHLEIELPADELDRPHAAMHPVVRVDDMGAARAVLRARLDDWPMRLRAPGGAQVIRDDEDGVALAIGGKRVGLSRPGARLIERLLCSRYLSAADLADELDLDIDLVAAGVGRLWRAGLLDPAPAPEPIRTNERLTQVATAQLGDDVVAPFVDAISPSAWRLPERGELPESPHNEITVQPLEPTGTPLGLLLSAVGTVNERFFRVETRPELTEPVLLVRVRPLAGSHDRRLAGGSVDQLESDLVGAATTRKLTYALSLTEAKGGWVHLPAGSDVADTTVGCLSVWTSFRPWALLPVAAGERLFLLGRVHGPAYA